MQVLTMKELALELLEKYKEAGEVVVDEHGGWDDDAEFAKEIERYREMIEEVDRRKDTKICPQQKDERIKTEHICYGLGHECCESCEISCPYR